MDLGFYGHARIWRAGHWLRFLSEAASKCTVLFSEWDNNKEAAACIKLNQPVFFTLEVKKKKKRVKVKLCVTQVSLSSRFNTENVFQRIKGVSEKHVLLQHGTQMFVCQFFSLPHFCLCFSCVHWMMSSSGSLILSDAGRWQNRGVFVMGQQRVRRA